MQQNRGLNKTESLTKTEYLMDLKDKFFTIINISKQIAFLLFENKLLLCYLKTIIYLFENHLICSVRIPAEFYSASGITCKNF